MSDNIARGGSCLKARSLEEIGGWMRTRRISLGLTLFQVANAGGVCIRVLGRMERGKMRGDGSELSLEKFFRLALAVFSIPSVESPRPWQENTPVTAIFRARGAITLAPVRLLERD